MRPRSSLLLALLLAASCGSSSDPQAQVDAGYSALSSGNHAEALSDFDAVLANDGGNLDARIGRMRALCYTDAAKAKSEFLDLAKTGKLQAGDFRVQVTDLVTAATAQAQSGAKDAATKTIGEAVEILQAGAKAFPEDPKWAVLTKTVGDKASSLGAADALSNLSGLGYVGGD
ncbi:MAG: hypothetical protein H6828_05705 [Planctomycetes bacterium]|nr:hypothetical protein [Planctomycetota bacterium]